MKIQLTTPIEELSRVGKTTASRLHRLGIYTARDLLFHFPHRYEDWSKGAAIVDLRPNQEISIRCTIDEIKNFRSPKRRMNITEALVSDQTGSIQVIWFNQPFLTKTLKEGTMVVLSGKTGIDRNRLLLKSPKYEVITDEGQETTYTNRILPVYPSALNLTQKQLQFLTHFVIHLAFDVQDPIPDHIRSSESLLELSHALKSIHEPETMQEVEDARRRFAFEELFDMQLQSYVLRQENQHFTSPKLTLYDREMKGFVDNLPFALTEDQRKTAYKIFLDCEKETPMNRLVQGDVGSGKTVVAAMAMYNASMNGYQAALMAPTEVLAYQHFKGLTKLFSHLDFPMALFTRSYKIFYEGGEEKRLTKKKLIEMIASGQSAITIGTHALIQKDVAFRQLGLAVIDEQHRFGVEQRKLLREYSGLGQDVTPHLLSLTATPIPRTLALVTYGDLAISSIRHMPKNRLPIKTSLVKEGNKKEVYRFIAQEITSGRQVYVVCPLIEESDKLGVTSVTQEYEKLVKIFPDFTIGLLHGKLKSEEKERIMNDFKAGKTQILVSTTVIEVGVDVANASIMLIEAAERFGFSQLHQIRGRVGRGEYQSYCFLVPTEQGTFSWNRLNQFIKCKNGFEVAELDLKTRGAGQVYGTQQSGLMNLQFADVTDTVFVEHISSVVHEFLEQHSLDEFPLLKEHIVELNKKVHLE